MTQTLSNALIRHSFTRIVFLSKLRILNDPKPLIRSNLTLYFTHWKELSQEDRRLQKLSYRAFKHRTRVVKS